MRPEGPHPTRNLFPAASPATVASLRAAVKVVVPSFPAAVRAAGLSSLAAVRMALLSTSAGPTAAALALSLCITLTLWAAPAANSQVAERLQPEGGYTLPSAQVQEFFERDTNHATLDQLGLDGNHFLVPLRTESSTLERRGEPTYRLASLEVRPGVDRSGHLDK